MHVKDIMRLDVMIADPDMTLQQAAHLMHDTDCDYLPVEKDSHLIGAVDRESIIRGLGDGYDGETTLRSVLNTAAPFYLETDTIDNAEHIMYSEPLKKLIVLNEARRIAGIIRFEDIARIRRELA